MMFLFHIIFLFPGFGLRRLRYIVFNAYRSSEGEPSAAARVRAREITIRKRGRQAATRMPIVVRTANTTAP